MVVNLFIDTNVLLSFFHYASEDLDELRKLSPLLDKGAMRLFLPEQVLWEFWRNRDNKLADAIKTIRAQRLDLQFPQICKDYPEYPILRALQKKYEAAHGELLKRVTKDAAGTALKADAVVTEICGKASRIAVDSAVVNRARMRVDLGNPPGKAGSVGDAINWEALLGAVPLNEDLHFVTDDRDFGSPLDGVDFSPFLSMEWTAQKHSAIRPYKKLSDFFSAHFQQIKLADKAEKDSLIEDLANSGTFASTHWAIARLSKFGEFTDAQVAAIVKGALSNNQVWGIMADEDVRMFMQKVVAGREAILEPADLRRLEKHWTPAEEFPEDAPD